MAVLLASTPNIHCRIGERTCLKPLSVDNRLHISSPCGLSVGEKWRVFFLECVLDVMFLGIEFCTSQSLWMRAISCVIQWKAGHISEETVLFDRMSKSLLCFC